MIYSKRFNQLLSAMVLLSVFLSGGISEAKILLIESCGVNLQPAQAVPVIREIANDVTIHGDYVDVHTSIEKSPLISVEVLGHGGGGGLNTFVTLRIRPATSIGSGPHTIKLHYPIELNGPDIFTIYVRTPRINSITSDPPPPFQSGQHVVITATGSSLTNAQLLRNDRAQFDDFVVDHPPSPADPANHNSVRFEGNVLRSFTLSQLSFGLGILPDRCLSNHAAGSARLFIDCPQCPRPRINPVHRPTIDQPSTVLLPDLVPTDIVNVRKGITARDCSEGSPGIHRFTQPDLKFGVRNISNVAVTTPFAVILRKADGTQLRRVMVSSLPENATAEFELHRARSEVCIRITALPYPPSCTSCDLLVDDTGIEVIVDFDNNVSEESETNNSRRIF